MGIHFVAVPPNNADLRPHAVTARALPLLLLGVAWLSSSGDAVADEAAVTTFLARRQAEEVACTPTLPHFCENMHVRCSGKTSVPTFEFKLRTTGSTGLVQLLTASEEFQRLYENANVEWDKDGDYVLLSPRATNGYVKLMSDGKYVFRHYIQSVGVMSLGHCK